MWWGEDSITITVLVAGVMTRFGELLAMSSGVCRSSIDDIDSLSPCSCLIVLFLNSYLSGIFIFTFRYSFLSSGLCAMVVSFGSFAFFEQSRT